MSNPYYPAGCTTAAHDAAWGEGDGEEPTRRCISTPGCTRPMTMSSECGGCLECALEGERQNLRDVIRQRGPEMTLAQFNEEVAVEKQVAKLYGAIQAHKEEKVAA